MGLIATVNRNAYPEARIRLWAGQRAQKGPRRRPVTRVALAQQDEGDRTLALRSRCHSSPDGPAAGALACCTANAITEAACGAAFSRTSARVHHGTDKLLVEIVCVFRNIFTARPVR